MVFLAKAAFWSNVFRGQAVERGVKEIKSLTAAQKPRDVATAWRGWEEITSKLWVKPHLGGLYMFIPPISGYDL